MYKKKLIYIMMLITVILLTFSIGITFANKVSDISGKWYEQTALNAIEKGWAKGYPDGSFRGDNFITRAEFVTMINRMLSNTSEIVNGNRFTDISENDWYYADILRAINLKIINGYEDETFKPNEYISRQDAIVIISRLDNLEQYDFEYDESEQLYVNDWKEADNYANSAITKLYTIRIVKGDENGNVNPKNNITRAEALAIIERTYNTVNKLLPEFIEPEFEIRKHGTYNEFYVFIKNGKDLHNYDFKFIYESPKQLNHFKSTSPLYGTISSVEYTEDSKPIKTLWEYSNEINLFPIDMWNIANEYQGYVPKYGEKITMKITVTNDRKTITKDYYLDYIVE